MTQEDLCELFPRYFDKRGNFQKNRVPQDIVERIHLLTPNCHGSLLERIHWITHGMMNYPKCLTCNGTITKWQPIINKRYASYCSVKCSASSETTKSARQSTVQQRYGADNVSQVNEINERRKTVFTERFGGDNPSSSSRVVEKRRQTFLDRFGGTSPMASPVTKDKVIQTNLKRYGVPYSQQSPEIRAKTNMTSLLRYGSHCSLTDPDVRAKAKATLLQNYGVNHPLQSPIIHARAAATNLERYGVINVGARPTHKALIGLTRRKSWLVARLQKLAAIATPLFLSDEYESVDYVYPWQCAVCAHQFKAHIDNGGFPRCPKCYKGNSIPQQEMREWLNTLNINFISNNRKIIAPLELDFVFPEHKIAIEFNGLYFHSEHRGLTDPQYHHQKTLMCAETSYALLHFFEDEWQQKSEIVKNIIRTKLGLNQRIFARKCIVKQIASSEAKQFMDKHHIQGSSICRHGFGLFHDDVLVAAMTFAKPRFDRKHQWEMVRFASITGWTIVGGASKLLHAFETVVQPKSLISYADLRFSTGRVYENLGFQLSHISPPSYFYMPKGYKQRLNRMGFQKKLLQEKLMTYEAGLTEWQNMIVAGYDRIWDCGQMVWSKSW